MRSSDCRPVAIFSVNKPDDRPTTSSPGPLQCAAPVDVQQPTVSLIAPRPLPDRLLPMPQVCATAPQYGEPQASPGPAPPRQPLSTLLSMAKDSKSPLSDLLARCTTSMGPPAAASPHPSGRSPAAGKSSALEAVLNGYVRGSAPLGPARQFQRGACQ